jgi:hypothetical protein
MEDKLRPEYGIDAPLQEYLDSTKIDMEKIGKLIVAANQALIDAEEVYKSVIAKIEELYNKIIK